MHKFVTIHLVLKKKVRIQTLARNQSILKRIKRIL